MAVLRLVCGDPDRVLNLQGMLSRKRFQVMQELMPQHPPHLCLQSLFIQMSVHPHEGTVIQDYEPAQVRIPVIFPQDQKFIAPNVIQSIAHMKHDILKGGYTSLNLDEALIGLAISCTTNPAAQIATEKLNELRGCEVHMTHIVTPGDEAGLRRLGCRFTSDPYFASNALFMAGQ